MEIREITDKNTWESFLAGVAEKTFLQSWNWGEFSREMGEKIWRLGIFDQNELAAVALTEKKTSKRGTFLLVPHGPITQSAAPKPKAEILNVLTERLKLLADAEKASFVRVNPIWERNPENNNLFKDFRPAPLQMHPESSWKLDIRPNPEDLLSQMRKTTRYLIRQAQKNRDIRIDQSQNLADVEKFSRFHDQVSQRQRFIPFSLEYLQKEFRAFAPDDGVRLFFGYHDNEVAAGSFVVFWSGIGFYHHAISLTRYAKFSIPYLLQWEAIQEAKRRNCVLYDFWGFIDPQQYPRHPWAGPTLFKMGFGGRVFEYVRTRDLPLSKKYWLTYFFERLRKIKRRL
ncbi:MAG: peptidoglycan bridge formation glycyltransferase FemA/FemB family protein [Candidatus Nealsonbacteria bacterium]|nr:peptidoglycan bridge formation glycyltransferase FemA/FemB family protein [Candidatus Nealsonbacteria bacterium]